MSLESEAPLEAGSLQRGRFTYFPVVPGRLEFAVELRKRLLLQPPDVVAVELPGWLERPYRRAIRRLPQFTVLVYPDLTLEDRAVYVPVEPADPFTEAVRTALELGIETVFLEPDSEDRPHLAEICPDSYAVRTLGLEKYVEAYRFHPSGRTEEVAAHAAAMAWKLQGTDPLAGVLVVVSLNLLDPLLDAMEQPQEAPSRRRYVSATSSVELVNPHPDCLNQITVEYPYLQERYERYRVELADDALVDRLRSQIDLYRDAEQSYRRNTGDRVEHWQRHMLARYTRNLAMINSQLVADVFDLAVAGRAVVDDNFAWEVWTTGARYPAQREVCELETVDLSAEEVWLASRKLRLRRRLPRPKRRLPTGLKARKKEKSAGEWARQVDGNAICSYPPEDLQIEDYGRFLKRKAKSILSEERTRSEPFRTSLLDGIDLRETIRNWYRGKIYVRQLERVAGEVGAVVVIFDEDREDRYPYLTTWLGEHQNESDMAFYSTNPFDHLVGPGIGRAEYGGFLMTLPPRRMIDVWTDPDYDFAETKPERLLLAGLDYALQRYVVYVAARPPRSIFRSISAHLGRTILYIPVGQLSPARLKKIRVVHVLDGHQRRQQARQYIW